MAGGEDREFIAEWPPPAPAAAPSPAEEEEGERERESKRLKLTTEEALITGGKAEEEPLIELGPEAEGALSHLIRTSPSITADTLLARWWKERTKKEEKSLLDGGVTASANPNTRLFHISRLDAAKEFLRGRISYLTSLGSGSKKSPYDIHFSIATCYHWLGPELECIQPALRHMQQALEVAEEGEDTREARWLLELLERQRVVEERKKRGAELIQKWPPEKLVFPPYSKVERRQCSSLTSTEFHEQYALTRTPVIITGIVEKMTSEPWTLDHIREVIGEKVAPVKKVVSGSVEWAQLEMAGECTVADFIDTLDSQTDEPRYLFDWSLPLHCPELMAELTIPDYFEGDLLRKTPEGSLYRESWPSLFVAPAGITSGLHVDAFGSNFWMALFQGRKRWIFFPPEDLPFLYPVFHYSTDATFQMDLPETSKTVSSHSLLALTHPRECVLEPGELLFVPHGSPHHVENVESSLAISSNFVDGSNLEAVEQELRVNGLLDPRAEELCLALQRLKP